MNFLAINPLFNTIPAQKKSETNFVSVPRFGLTMAQPLSKDAISFKARHFNSVNKLGDFVEVQVKNTHPRFEEAANVYMVVLDAVATKFADKGVTFDKEYCDPHKVKEIKRLLDKLLQTCFDVRDGVRATLFVKDLYDLSILNDCIIPEMTKIYGYKLASVDLPLNILENRGYIPKPSEIKKGFVKTHDLDVRLQNKKIQREKLDPKYRFLVSNELGSGYEDIQLRFKKGGILHELILIFGKNYAKAKTIESEHVYSHLRRFNEISLFERFNNENNPQVPLMKRSIEIIKTLVRSEISKKIFENAKSLDIYGSDLMLPIKINNIDRATLKENFDFLEKEIIAYYKKRVVKAGKNEKYARKLEEAEKEDLTVLKEIRTGLRKAIDYFNNGEYLKEFEK